MFGVAGLVNDLYLVHYLGRQILEGHLRVVEEEGLAADGDLVDGLAVVFYCAVFRYLHARHPLEQVFQHGIFAHDKGGSVENDGVLPDFDRIADGRHVRGVEHLGVFRHMDDAQVHGIPVPVKGEIALLVVGPVTQHLDGQDVGAARHFLDARPAGGVGQGKIGDEGVVLGRQVGRCIGNRFVGAGFQRLDDDGTLVPLKKTSGNELGLGCCRGQQAAKYNKDTFHHDIRTHDACKSYSFYSVQFSPHSGERPV